MFMTNVSFCKSPSVDVLVTSGDSRPLLQFGNDAGWVIDDSGGGHIIPGSAGLYAAVDGGGTRTASRPGRATGWNLLRTPRSTWCCCCCWCNCITKSTVLGFMNEFDSMAAALRGGSSRPGANEPPTSVEWPTLRSEADDGGGRCCWGGGSGTVDCGGAFGSARDADIDRGSGTVNGIRCCPRPTGERHASAPVAGLTPAISGTICWTPRCFASKCCSCCASLDGCASASRRSLDAGDEGWRVASSGDGKTPGAYDENGCGGAGDRPTAGRYGLTAGIWYWPTDTHTDPLLLPDSMLTTSSLTLLAWCWWVAQRVEHLR